MPKAMFGATPPRRTTRSSTRKDNEILCRCSASSCSLNLPGKCMRWSVAMEPLTRIGTMLHATQSGCENGKTAGPGSPGPAVPVGSAAERVAAGAAARGVRVVDREALLLDGVGEVDGGAAQVRGAHPVDDDRHAVR